jgi:hypothetical protein
MDFGKFLSELFQTDPNWEFMPHPDFPTEYRVALTKGGSRVFLNGFGDGIRFCIVLVATCMLSRALKTKTRLIDSFCSYIELRETETGVVECKLGTRENEAEFDTELVGSSFYIE